MIGDATSDGVLIHAGIKSAKGLVACADSDVVNVYVTLSARALNPRLAHHREGVDQDTEKKLRMAGADRVLSPYFISGVRMAAMATSPVISDFLDLVTQGGQLEFNLFEVTVPPDSVLTAKLSSRRISGSSGAMVLAIRYPDGSFDLQPRGSSCFNQIACWLRSVLRARSKPSKKWSEIVGSLIKPTVHTKGIIHVSSRDL